MPSGVNLVTNECELSLVIMQMSSQPWIEAQLGFILLAHETPGTSPTGCELTSSLCPTTVLSNRTDIHADLFGPRISPRPLHMSFEDESLTYDSDIHASISVD